VGEVMSARRDVAVAVSANLRREPFVMGLKEISLLVSAFFLEGVCLLAR